MNAGSNAFDGIAQGLREAIAISKGDASVVRKARTHSSKTVKSKKTAISDIKTARKQVGLTRYEFADAFGLSPATLRKWENGERKPTGAARVLMTIIAKEPKAVLRAIRE